MKKENSKEGGKNKSKSSKFLRGALLGTALGVATGMFARSKTGKKLGRELKEKSADFYKSVEPVLKNVVEAGGKEYKKFVNKTLTDYKKNKK